MKIWIRPSFGLFFGIVNANKNQQKKETAGNGGIILGDIAVQIGGLLGSVVGVGENLGLFSGLLAGIALIPFLGFSFIGLPIGVHFKKKFGFGIILPLTMVDWWIALIGGIVLTILGFIFKNENEN